MTAMHTTYAAGLDGFDMGAEMERGARLAAMGAQSRIRRLEEERLDSQAERAIKQLRERYGENSEAFQQGVDQVRLWRMGQSEYPMEQVYGGGQQQKDFDISSALKYAEHLTGVINNPSSSPDAVRTATEALHQLSPLIHRHMGFELPSRNREGTASDQGRGGVVVNEDTDEKIRNAARALSGGSVVPAGDPAYRGMENYVNVDQDPVRFGPFDSSQVHRYPGEPRSRTGFPMGAPAPAHDQRTPVKPGAWMLRSPGSRFEELSRHPADPLSQMNPYLPADDPADPFSHFRRNMTLDPNAPVPPGVAPRW